MTIFARSKKRNGVKGMYKTSGIRWVSKLLARKIGATAILLCSVVPAGIAQSPHPDTSDLWYFQLAGPVKSALIKGRSRIYVEFDRQGRITRMTQDWRPVTVHRNEEGRIDSTTTERGRVDDHYNTKYRQRATDERGNWMARKTQQQDPYFIGTEYCETSYYE